MAVHLPKPQQGSADYSAKFTVPAFGLLEKSTALSKEFFAALHLYGARLEDLRIEGQNTGNVTLALHSFTPSNFIARLRLDSLQITFHSLETIGPENAKQLVLDCWRAIHEIDNSVEPERHTIITAYQFAVSTGDYKTILSNFTKMPKGLPAGAHGAVAFYLPGGSEIGDVGGAIVLDRMTNGELNLRITMNVDGKATPTSELSGYVETYINKILSALDIEVEVNS